MDTEAAAPAGGRPERAAEEEELARLVARLAEDTGVAVVLQDEQFRVLAAGGAGARAALDPAHCHIPRQIAKRAVALREPTLLEVGYRPTRLVVPVVVGGDLLGFITAEHPAPDDELGKRLERAAVEIGLEMAVELRVQAILGDDERDFFSDLLEGRTPHRMVRRGFKLGYDVRLEHTPLAVAAERAGSAAEVLQRIPRTPGGPTARPRSPSWAGTTTPFSPSCRPPTPAWRSRWPGASWSRPVRPASPPPPPPGPSAATSPIFPARPTRRSGRPGCAW